MPPVLSNNVKGGLSLATINTIDDHGLETIRKAGMIPDDTNATQYAIRTNMVDSSGNSIVVNDDGQLHVVLDGKIDETNSSDTPLGADETFTGEWVNISAYAAMSLLVRSDQASATDGLQVQFSPDGIEAFDGESYTIDANATKFFTPPVQSLYYRVEYTNGSTEQTSFNLHVMLKKTAIKWSSHNLTDNLDDGDDATLSLAVLKLRTAQDNYVTGAATSNGNFKVSLEELESGISSNSNSQLNVTPFHADGTEGALISGVDYVSGKSGIDASTETLQTITNDHHEIHSGSHFTVDGVVDLSINNVYDLQITTPNTTKWTHLIFDIGCESETQFLVYEGVTINLAGTAETIFNNNRNSDTTSTLTVNGISNTSVSNANTDTAVAQATLLINKIIGAGRNAGSDSRGREIVLKQNTVYTIRFIATTAGFTNYQLDWYEHTDKN